MKNVQLFILFVLAVVVAACAGNANQQDQLAKQTEQEPQKPQGVVFNPGPSPEEKVDADREAKLAAKREAFNAVQDPMANFMDFEGKIKLTVMVPDENLSIDAAKQLESKLIQMVTMNGIGGIGGNPRYVLAPDVNILKHEVTSTAPVRHLVMYNITFYVADIVLGTVFSSSNIQATGVGDSETLAFVAAFNDLKPTASNFQKMLADAQTKITEYYKQHGAEFLQEAKMLAAKGEYGQAMVLLGSIPTETGKIYEQATKEMDRLLPKYLEKECNLILSQFQAALGNQMNGVNKEAMAYYAMIPGNSPCKAEANAALNAYKAKLSAEDARQWDRESEQIRSDNEFRRLEAELEAKVTIASNKCLLDAYKKQASYSRLPWIRKVIHLGDMDPFDGYTPEKGC